MKIIKNQARCRLCGDLVVSHSRTEYEYCRCGALGVSGGDQAILRLGNFHQMIELSEKEYSD